MSLLRWEFVGLFEPWAAPQSTMLGAPIASGSVSRDDAIKDDAFFAPSAPIVAPAAPDGGRHVILVLEPFGAAFPWLITFGTGSSAPPACDGLIHPIDPVAHVIVPPPGMQGTARSREIRAVRPGTLIIAQPSRG